jgi:Protein of unknown function (DUF5818)
LEAYGIGLLPFSIHVLGGFMKQISLLTLLLAASSSVFAQDKSGTFSGEIMDKQCAQMGSHENMMKTEGAKDAKECTLACVKNGGSFVLLDPQTKKVYRIDDEKKVREYAGERVQITGNYDQDTDVLHIKTITRQQ